jgi:hypothetical protein
VIAPLLDFVLDHLWQSTLFAAAAGLVTFLLQGNAARALVCRAADRERQGFHAGISAAELITGGGLASSKQACVLMVTLLALSISGPAWAQVQSVIVPTLPSLTPVEKGEHDPDAIYCRPPQYQSDSRLLGPLTCKTNRTWDDLHVQGLDIGADGKSIVASEKYRSVRGQ